MHAAVLNDFAAALIDPARDVPEFITSYTAHRPPKRFAVYRNNVASSLINALRTRFPATEKIVGDEFFAAMAHLFITGNLPRSPVLMFYGDAYPDFIAGFEPARELPYLPDVARLEAARTHAYHAADAVPFGADRLTAMSPQELMRARVTLHPSLQVVPSRYPIVTIWAMNSGERELAPVELTGGEDALVLRPQMTVLVQSLPAGGAALLGALGRGMTIGAAVEQAATHEDNFDLPASLALLLGSGVVTAWMKMKR